MLGHVEGEIGTVYCTGHTHTHANKQERMHGSSSLCSHPAHTHTRVPVLLRNGTVRVCVCFVCVCVCVCSQPIARLVRYMTLANRCDTVDGGLMLVAQVRMLGLVLWLVKRMRDIICKTEECYDAVRERCAYVCMCVRACGCLCVCNPMSSEPAPHHKHASCVKSMLVVLTRDKACVCVSHFMCVCVCATLRMCVLCYACTSICACVFLLLLTFAVEEVCQGGAEG